jgi:arylsulfatase A-like enzyme
MPSVFTSLYPSFHGTLAKGGVKRALHESHTTLAEILQQAGYTTIELTTNPNLRSVFGMTQGFDRVEEFRSGFYSLGLCRALRRLRILDTPHFVNSRYGYPRADELTDYALRYMSAAKDRPFFLYVHYMDTHHGYFPPPPYDTFFGDGSKEPNPGVLFGKTVAFMADSTGRIEISPEELAKLKDYYDGCIRFNDEQLGRILDEVRILSETRETVVIITADHGDEFLEHGRFYHTNLLFEELLHVPLIIWDPQRFSKGLKVESLVRLIDLLPTIAETVGANVPPEAMGTSLVPLLTGEVEDLDMTAIAEGNYCYSLNYKNWKIMKVDSTDTVYLYDLSSDPGETTDVSSQQPQVFKEMNALLEEYLKKIDLIEHAPETDLDPETIRQLKALGYLQ